MKNTLKPFLSNILEIRSHAREHVMRGAVTNDYRGDVGTAVRILNDALATEIVCALRYRNHYYMADGIQAESVAAEFLEHAREEELHADWIAVRIRQLNGKTDLNPAHLLERSHAEYREGDTLIEMITEDLVAERIAIESYREMIRYFGDNDPTSRGLIERILAQEEEHAEELSSLLVTLDRRNRAATAA